MRVVGKLMAFIWLNYLLRTHEFLFLNYEWRKVGWQKSLSVMLIELNIGSYYPLH